MLVKLVREAFIQGWVAGPDRTGSGTGSGRGHFCEDRLPVLITKSKPAVALYAVSVSKGTKHV